MEQFVIEVSKENVDAELYQMSSLPPGELSAGIRNGIVLSGRIDGRSAAVCVIEKREDVFEILHWAALPEFRKKGYGKELLLYTLDYINVMGGRFVEVGAPNTDVQMFTLLQRLGFRITGVRTDYYPEEGRAAENKQYNIKMRDMIRYMADLRELLDNIRF